MDIVRVRFYRPAANAYGGREYTYRTTLPLRVNDAVLVPTDKDPRQKAIVTGTGLPESVIDPAWADRVKTITEYDTGEAQV